VAKKQQQASNGISDFIKEIWQAAVQMRGSIEPADYKRYVLPLIFLRFLSIRFEKRRHELTEMVCEPESLYYTDSSQEAQTIIDDPDEYHSVGAFMVPEVATWDYIMAHAQDDDIKVKIDDALEALERNYPDQLRGLLPRIFAGSNIDVENLRGLINLFSKKIFAEEHSGTDLIGRVFEYFIGEFASSEGKRGGEYFTPESIVKCLVKMIEPTEGVVMDPCCGSGSKSADGWGADRIPKKDPRLKLGDQYMPLAPKNANTMWIMQFLYHLREGGTAGFVIATGELTNSETARIEVRKHLVDLGYVDCIVQLTGQLFANTQIPCSLWFLSKNRDGSHGMRARKNEILFIDGRSLGVLIPGSRKQKALSEEELERIASVYREFRRNGVSDAQPGFAAVATIDAVREYNYALSPGRYVGSEEIDEDSEPFEELFPELAARLKDQMSEGRRLQEQIERNLDSVVWGDA